MADLNSKIKRLEEQLKEAKLKKKIQTNLLRQKENKKRERIETRKKILLGAFVLDCLGDKDSVNLSFGIKRFKDWLVRNNDRALFGLVEDSNHEK